MGREESGDINTICQGYCQKIPDRRHNTVERCTRCNSGTWNRAGSFEKMSNKEEHEICTRSARDLHDGWRLVVLKKHDKDLTREGEKDRSSTNENRWRENQTPIDRGVPIQNVEAKAGQ